MDSKIINRIIENLDNENPGKKVFFSDSRYASIDFSKSNFGAIKKPSSARKIAFIDGGNAEIIGGANFSLQLVRLYYSIWQNNKKIKAHKDEYYILINAVPKKDKGFDKLRYETQIFRKGATTKSIIEEELKDQMHKSIVPDKEDLSYDSMDGTITEGINRARPSKIGEIARRFSEINACALVVDELSAGDFIVIDGTLQSSVTNEGKQLNALYSTAAAKGVIVTAFAKTNTLLTDTGNSASYAIQLISPKGSWCYHPVVDIRHPDHKAEMFILKLHEKAKHVFRFEIQKEMYLKNPACADEIIGLLSEISKDAVFLGYPYGLIDADKFARISNQELKSLRTQFMVKSGKKWEQLMSKNNSVNAHDVLDSIS